MEDRERVRIYRESFKEIYNDCLVGSQLQKYKNRQNNHLLYRSRYIRELVGDIAGKRILDLGCGVGVFALEYAKLGCKTVGIDLNPKIIDLAKDLAREEGLTNCTFMVGDASGMGFPDNSFDIIIAADIIEHLPPEILDQTLKECHRLLVKGGKLVFHTTPTRYAYVFGSLLWHFPLIPFCVLPQRYLDKIIEVYEQRPLQIIHKLIKGGTRYDIVARSAHCNCLSYQELQDYLVKTGFIMERYFAVNFPTDGKRYGFTLFQKSFHVNTHLLGAYRKPEG